mmetsp:Transcript_19984/g.20297  ORF Transcript_19984/g.20297 Transcript_19984/m.20297 type:complete len:98 (-) Transcript_19984:357-650(-)
MNFKDCPIIGCFCFDYRTSNSMLKFFGSDKFTCFCCLLWMILICTNHFPLPTEFFSVLSGIVVWLEFFNGEPSTVCVRKLLHIIVLFSCSSKKPFTF